MNPATCWTAPPSQVTKKSRASGGAPVWPPSQRTARISRNGSNFPPRHRASSPGCTRKPVKFAGLPGNSNANGGTPDVIPWVQPSPSGGRPGPYAAETSRRDPTPPEQHARAAKLPPPPRSLQESKKAEGHRRRRRSQRSARTLAQPELSPHSRLRRTGWRTAAGWRRQEARGTRGRKPLEPQSREERSAGSAHWRPAPPALPCCTPSHVSRACPSCRRSAHRACAARAPCRPPGSIL